MYFDNNYIFKIKNNNNNNNYIIIIGICFDSCQIVASVEGWMINRDVTP